MKKFKTQVQFSLIPVFSTLAILVVGVLVFTYKSGLSDKVNAFKQGELTKATLLTDTFLKLSTNHATFLELLSRSQAKTMSEEELYESGQEAIDSIAIAREQIKSIKEKGGFNSNQLLIYKKLLKNINEYEKAMVSSIEMVSAHISLSSKYMLTANHKFFELIHDINFLTRNSQKETERTVDDILKSSRQMVENFVLVFIATASFVFLFSFLIIKKITQPIIDISHFVSEVKEKENYATRYQGLSNNIEITNLTDGLNDFLSQIEYSQKKIKDHNVELEEKVNRRTKELTLRSIQLERAKKAAEESNMAKSQFLTNMSHELRTPLNAVIGYSEILEEELEDLQQLEDIRKIQLSGEHLLNLINDVLDISKLESPQFASYGTAEKLPDLIQEVADTIMPMMTSHGNKLEVEYGKAPESFSTDGKRLRQILLNLLSNAGKFTKNGNITLSASMRVDKKLEFRITDTGSGISPENLEKVFDKFVQVHNIADQSLAGTGLGLSISRSLTTILGGEMDVESKVGQGSVFHFYITEFKGPSPWTKYIPDRKDDNIR